MTEKSYNVDSAYDAIVDGHWSIIFPKDMGNIEDVPFEEVLEWEEFLSESLREQLGCTPEHPNRAKTWMDIIYPDDLQMAYKAMVDHVNSKGDSKYDLVVRYKTYDGKHIRVQCTGNAIWAGDRPHSMDGMHRLIEVSDKELDL